MLTWTRLMLLLTMLVCAGCSCDDTLCTTVLFQSDLESYTPDRILYPLEPPADPAGDRFIVGSDDAVTVIDSPILGSQAVALHYNTMGTHLECVVDDGPHSSGLYKVTFDAYATGTVEQALSVSVHSFGTTANPSAERAFSLGVYSGVFKLTTHDGEETLAGVSYSPNVVHSVYVEIDMDNETLSMKIDGVTVATDKSFEQHGFDDLRTLRFGFNMSMTSDDAYIIDDIMILKCD